MFPYESMLGNFHLKSSHLPVLVLFLPIEWSVDLLCTVVHDDAAKHLSNAQRSPSLDLSGQSCIPCGGLLLLGSLPSWLKAWIWGDIFSIGTIGFSCTVEYTLGWHGPCGAAEIPCPASLVSQAIRASVHCSDSLETHPLDPVDVLSLMVRITLKSLHYLKFSTKSNYWSLQCHQWSLNAVFVLFGMGGSLNIMNAILIWLRIYLLKEQFI